VKDIIVVYADGLSGFAESIRVAAPKVMVQRCVVYLVRKAMQYATKLDTPEVVKNLKTIGYI
jgi:putative transposase